MLTLVRERKARGFDRFNLTGAVFFGSLPPRADIHQMAVIKRKRSRAEKSVGVHLSCEFLRLVFRLFPVYMVHVFI